MYFGGTNFTDFPIFIFLCFRRRPYRSFYLDSLILVHFFLSYSDWRCINYAFGDDHVYCNFKYLFCCLFVFLYRAMTLLQLHCFGPCILLGSTQMSSQDYKRRWTVFTVCIYTVKCDPRVLHASREWSQQSGLALIVRKMRETVQ